MIRKASSPNFNKCGEFIRNRALRRGHYILYYTDQDEMSVVTTFIGVSFESTDVSVFSAIMVVLGVVNNFIYLRLFTK